MEQIATIGLAIAKNIFQVHGVDAVRNVVVRRRLRWGDVQTFFAKLQPTLIGIEACAMSHHWARRCSALGHNVKLMPDRTSLAWRTLSMMCLEKKASRYRMRRRGK